jgi:hypothetical protein
MVVDPDPGQRGSAGLAGAPGFEPGNGGTKNRCLTAWRRPNGGVYIIGSGGAGNRFCTFEDIPSRKPDFSPCSAPRAPL